MTLPLTSSTLSLLCDCTIETARAFLAIHGNNLNVFQPVIKPSSSLHTEYAAWRTSTQWLADVACKKAVLNHNAGVLRAVLQCDIQIKNFSNVFLHTMRRGVRLEYAAVLLQKATTKQKLDLLRETDLNANVDRLTRAQLFHQVCQSGVDIGYVMYGSPLLFRLFDYPEILVKCAANFNAHDDSGDNACHLFSVRPYPTSVFALVIQKGADPTLTNFRGETPWNMHCYYETDVERFALLFLAGVQCGSALTQDADVDNKGFRALTRRKEARDLSDKLTLLYQDLCRGKWCDENRQLVCSLSRSIIKDAGMQICIGLQALDLPALVLCEILQAYYHMWPRIPFHCYWQLVVAVKHFRQ